MENKHKLLHSRLSQSTFTQSTDSSVTKTSMKHTNRKYKAFNTHRLNSLNALINAGTALLSPSVHDAIHHKRVQALQHSITGSLRFQSAPDELQTVSGYCFFSRLLNTRYKPQNTKFDTARGAGHDNTVSGNESNQIESTAHYPRRTSRYSDRQHNIRLCVCLQRNHYTNHACIIFMTAQKLLCAFSILFMMCMHSYTNFLVYAKTRLVPLDFLR